MSESSQPCWVYYCNTWHAGAVDRSGTTTFQLVADGDVEGLRVQFASMATQRRINNGTILFQPDRPIEAP